MRARIVGVVVALAVVALVTWLGSALPRETPPPGGRAPAPAGRYEPRSADPADAIPGGGLAAHEGAPGGHTLARHVGRSVGWLARRARTEGKREVSSFPDAGTADRCVAAVLFRRRDEVRRWLVAPFRGDRDLEARLDEVAGTVVRADTGRGTPGHTVRVVLAPSDRFPEGFVVRTAYVSLP